MNLKQQYKNREYFKKLSNVLRFCVLSLISVSIVFCTNPALSFERSFLQDTGSLKSSIKQNISDDDDIDLSEVEWDELWDDLFSSYLDVIFAPLLKFNLEDLTFGDGAFEVSLDPPLDLGGRFCEIASISFLSALTELLGIDLGALAGVALNPLAMIDLVRSAEQDDDGNITLPSPPAPDIGALAGMINWWAIIPIVTQSGPIAAILSAFTVPFGLILGLVKVMLTPAVIFDFAASIEACA